MAKISLTVNKSRHEVDIDPETPLLWVLRDVLGLTGTKYGCGIGLCGSCVVLVDDVARRSCLVSMSQADGKSITTIEGLSEDNSHPLQKAWIAEQVPQCGYCQSGQIMQAASLLNSNPNPSDADINASMSKVLCRCGSYNRIRRAIHQAAAEIRHG